MARAQEVFVVVDGALWLWSLIEDRFSGTTQTLDFYHASQRLWELAHYLYANDAEAARLFVEPLLQPVPRSFQAHRPVLDQAWPAQPPGSRRYDPKQNFRLPLELEILTNRRCALERSTISLSKAAASPH